MQQVTTTACHSSSKLCCQSWPSRPLLRRSGAARPPSATGMDIAARFNVAVGAAAITAKRRGIWTGFLRRYIEAVEILKTLAWCWSAHLRGCNTRWRYDTDERRHERHHERCHLLHAQEHAASLRHYSYLSFPKWVVLCGACRLVWSRQEISWLLLCMPTS